MGLINALFGTATQIAPKDLEVEFGPILIQGEQITGAFKIVRDLVVFTQWRLILTDKQGITGKKVSYHSIPYRNITQFSVETAGHFDMDSELLIWVSGVATPIKKEFRKGTDIKGVQQLLAHYILSSATTSSRA